MSGDDEPVDPPEPEQLSFGEGWLPPAGTDHWTADAEVQSPHEIAATERGAASG